MDLWDLTRLLIRRWYIALPILLASVLAAAVVGQSVKPDYRATGNVVMIPAPGPSSAEAKPEQGEPARPRNPWADLGFEALGNAAILTVLDQKTLKSLSDAGLSDSITVQMTPRTPILVIEAVGDSPAQTTATVRAVIKLLVAEVAAQQRRFDVSPRDTITTLTLTDGADVEAVTSKVKRVLIVIVGLGLLVTAGGTIGLDVLLRRRRRRVRVDPGPDREADTDAASGPVSARAPLRLDPGPSVADAAEVTGRLPVAAPAGDTYRRPEPAAAGDRRHTGGEPNTARSAEGREQMVAQSKRAARAVDETIVLPPSREQWGRHEDRNGVR